jgi:hypothetical protein
MHTGTSGFPAANAFPCTLPMYVSATSGWQAAQVSEILVRGSAFRVTSCAPWQSTHPGAMSFPFASCLAWTPSNESAYLSKWHGLHVSRKPAWNSEAF